MSSVSSVFDEGQARKPDFFIIGAPKCGTTAMAGYLAAHPEICMSDPKEPHFFNSDFQNRHTHSLRQYAACFASATAQHKAVGEASVLYLYSDVAIANILAFQPDARFIVMLRNPVDMAISWHSEALYSSSVGETVTDFPSAWSLQQERKSGRAIPAICKEPKVLYYKDICSLGAQLKRLQSLVPGQRILLVWQEDFLRDGRAEYLRVLDFLGVSDDGRMDFPRVNTAKQIKYPGFYHFFVYVRNRLKALLGIKGAAGIGARLRHVLTEGRVPVSLPDAFLQELQREFADDMILLQKLTGRNLLSGGRK